MSKNKMSCCLKWFQESWAITKRFAIVIFAQLIGWAIFSYVEDDLNVIDCFANSSRVADKLYPLSNETETAAAFFSKLYNKTGQVLTLNQSIATYSLFKTYFNVPNQEVFLTNDRAYRGCVKWFRFSVVTMTTIGFGVVTAKTAVGKLLVIPYALVTIPLMLSFLAFVGSLISKWADAALLLVHKCTKSKKPLRYKEVKRCFCLFITFWVVSMIVMSGYIGIPNAFKSTGAMRWLDGMYFLFVTFSTIGFGDMSGPAQDPSFFMWNFAVGLAAMSGFTDSFISLISSIEFTSRHGTRHYCVRCDDGGGSGDDVEDDNGNRGGADKGGDDRVIPSDGNNDNTTYL